MRDAHGDDDDLYNLSASGLDPDYKTDEYASAVCFQCQWVTEKKAWKTHRTLLLWFYLDFIMRLQRTPRFPQ